MRQIRITVSTVWTVDEDDNEMADALLKAHDVEAAMEYMDDAPKGNTDLTTDMTPPEVKWEEVTA